MTKKPLERDVFCIMIKILIKKSYLNTINKYNLIINLNNKNAPIQEHFLKFCYRIKA